jgi:PelA/Pel-15E family pectate lyase
MSWPVRRAVSNISSMEFRLRHCVCPSRSLLGAVFALILGCSSGEPAPGENTGSGGTGTAGTGGSAGAGAGGGATGGAGGASGAAGQTGGGSSGQSGSGTGGGSSGAGAGGASGESGAGASGGTGPAGAGGASGETSGGASGTGGDAGGASGSAGQGGDLILDQTGNPIYGQLDNYREWLSEAAGDAEKLTADRARADNILTWQMPHGGFDKNDVEVYSAPWNGSDPRSGWTGDGGVELGTIDNDGTVTELMFLADVYQRSGEGSYRDGARAALDFLLTMQYPSGGFPQVYPARSGGSYSNHVTFNDNAMARVLILLHQIVAGAAPLGGDLFTDAQKSAAATAIADGVEYILAAQIVQDGVRTVWCAQHDPESHEPLGARSYELPSKSGSESVGVATFLMTQPQTPEIEAAVRAAIAWFASAEVKLEDTAYVSRPSGNTDDNYNPIQASPGSTMWCRFYDLDQDVCFFSGRLPTDDPPGEGKQYDIMDIEPERRYGYQWGGGYGTRLLTYAASVGYYP